MQQFPLSLGKTACDVCPHLTQRCEGQPLTVESYLMDDSSVIGCRDIERIMEFHEDTNKFHILPQPSLQSNLVLPSFIPVIKPKLPGIPNFDDGILFGVTLSTLLKKSGDLRYTTPQNLRGKLCLPSNARLALIGTAQDFYLERFWKLTNTRNLWQRLAQLDFVFATSTTFSVWEQHPRSDQINSQTRNFLSHDLLASCGIPVIPFIFFHSQSNLDYEYVINWLKNRPDVNN